MTDTRKIEWVSFPIMGIARHTLIREDREGNLYTALDFRDRVLSAHEPRLIVWFPYNDGLWEGLIVSTKELDND